jgi:hypothetical protein
MGSDSHSVLSLIFRSIILPVVVELHVSRYYYILGHLFTHFKYYVSEGVTLLLIEQTAIQRTVQLIQKLTIEQTAQLFIWLRFQRKVKQFYAQITRYKH